MGAIITGIGVNYPDNVLTNADLEKMVDTSDEWIQTRTGIKERRIVPQDSGIKASDLGTAALNQALENAGLKAGELDGIICATANSDYHFPATSCIIQQNTGARGFAFDVTAACAGFVYGLNIASLMINSGQCRNIAIVGTEHLSAIVDWTDRNTCILFGDGAGAAIVSACDDQNRGVLNSTLQSDGTASGILYQKNTTVTSEKSFLNMDGRAVFKLAVKALTEIVLETLKKENLSTEDVDLAVFHQANLRILASVAKNLNLPDEKVVINVDRFGNTSSASIPIALYEAQQAGRLKPGDLIVLAAIGSGMTWGCNVIRW